MAETNNTQWFTEVFGDEGTEFGLQISEKLHEEQSEFQKIEVYQTKTFGKLLVLDGCVMLTDRDNFLYHEMMTHPALFTHPHPVRVAIIGGGDCGTLQQVLKHETVLEAIQIEIDPRVTRVSEEYFPALCANNKDPRAKLLFEDGLRWVEQQAASSLDVLIIDSTDPVGPAAGLFAVDFYRACQRVLGEDGILVQQTESPILHHDTIIKNAHQDMRTAGFSATQSILFPQPVYPSGWWSATMAGKRTALDAFRRDAAQAQQETLQYYTADIHQGALSMPGFLARSINSIKA